LEIEIEEEALKTDFFTERRTIMTTEKQKQEISEPQESKEDVGVLDQLLSKVNMKSPERAMSLDEAIKSESGSGRLAFAINHFVQAVAESGTQVEMLDKTMIDMAIANLDKKIGAQVNEIIHHPDFQELESSWRGLYFAIERTDFRQNIKMELMNCSMEKLREDFEDTPDIVQSGLYKQIYKSEYDTPGAAPVAAMIGNYEFDKSIQDMTLLQNVSKVAASTHCPFLTSVGADFFGEKDISAISSKPDISSFFDQAEYMRWNSFRSSEDSRYVGLTLNKFLGRLPYGEEGEKVKTFSFEEDYSAKEKYLWTNPAFAFLSNINRSFAKNGWAVNIRGPQAGGKVDDLPTHIFESSKGKQIRIPTEMLLAERQEFELAESGFIPLSIYKGKNFGVFFSAHSAQKPVEYNDKAATANARLSANLPYLFLVSRLAHYLKVLQREEIGSAREKEDIQKELSKWINSLVTKASSPTAEQKAKYPLREAKIEVFDSKEAPGYYHVSMKVRPHFQVEGVDIDLSLVARMPKK